MSDHIEIVPAEGELAEEAVRTAGVPFSFEVDAGEMERVVRSMEPGRFFVPRDGAEVVGSGGSWRYDVTVPGGARVPTAGVTFVTVLPTHRRRGVLRKMMRVILDEAHERGEPLAALWASEATIYGRFGFGQAVATSTLRLESRRAAWRTERPAGSMRLISKEEAREVLPPLHAAVCERHGMFARSDHLWDTYELSDELWDRSGYSALRIGVWHGDDGPEGYLCFRTKLQGAASVRVSELHGLTPEAHRALVGFAADIDLTDEVLFQTRPVDDPLPWMLVDSRAVATTGSEYVWFRMLDLPGVLTARTYERPGGVVLEVHDPFCDWNEGRWRLEVSGEGATCVRTDQPAEVTLDIAELSALVLGGRAVGPLAEAGRITGDPAALATLDAMMRTASAPWSSERF